MALDVAVEDLPGSQKKLSITVSADECTKAYENVLGRLSKNVSIPRQFLHWCMKFSPNESRDRRRFPDSGRARLRRQWF